MTRKAYIAHEWAYRRMREQGIRSWDEFVNRRKSHALWEVKAFLDELFRREIVRKGGRAIELGCGTGPLLRWLGEKGFGGLGVDISPMAIRMAKEQSAGTRLRFAVGDVTRLDKVKDSAFDLAVDGHCLHCITNPADRTKFFRECRRILRPGGVLVVETMARPVSRESTPGRLRGNVLYNPAPVPDVETYEGARCIGGRWCLPMRYLDRWQNILHAVEREGFEVVLLRLSAPSKESFSSTLSVAAVKR